MATHGEPPGLGLNLIIYPGDLVGAARVGKIARSLQSSGMFSATHAIGMTAPGLSEHEKLAPHVDIVRLRRDTRKSLVAKGLELFRWCRRVVREYQGQNVVAVSAQRALVLPLAYHVSKRMGALLAYNAHELETEILGFTGVKQQVFKFIERRYIKHVSLISVVNESIADWYVNEYPDIPRPIVLTNTPIDNGDSIDLKGELGISKDELLYIHVGYISPGRNVPLMLKEFAASPKVHVVFLGDGDMRRRVVKASKRSPNIHWHPMVEPDAVVSYARGADIGLCLVESGASLSDELSTPNKLLESWVAGIPPLSSGLREAKRLLGSQLSETWVLESPEQELSEALQRITTADVAEFKKQWKPVPSWDEQAVDLVEGYRKAIARKR